MSAFFKVLDKTIETLEGILGVVMILSVLFEVLARYLLPFSTTWTEEVARYCLVWGMLLGCGYGFGKNYHIIIDVLINKLNLKNKRIFAVISNLLTLVFCGIMLALSIERFPSIAKQYMTMAPVSFGWVFAALPAGLSISIVYCLRSTFLLIKDGGEAQ